MNPSPSREKTFQKAFGSQSPQYEASFSLLVQILLPRSLPELCTLHSNGEHCHFVTQAVHLCWQPMQKSPSKLKSWTTQLNSKGAAAQRYSCTEAPALCLDLNRILDKLLSQKGGLFKLCEGKNWWKTGFFTSGKLWKPCEGFVSPSPVLTQDAACKSEWWVYKTPTGVQGHAAAGVQPQVCHTHRNSRNHCRLQLLVLRGLNPPRYFRVFLYVLIIYKLWKATQDVSQLHLITHSAGKTCMSAISCTLWNVGKQ